MEKKIRKAEGKISTPEESSLKKYPLNPRITQLIQREKNRMSS